MNYYQVIPAMKLPYDYLTYASAETIERGQIVRIPVRKKLQYAVVIKKQNNLDFDPKLLKFIESTTPFKLSDNQINFLHIFSFNTFNKLGLSSLLFIQPFKILPKKIIDTLDIQTKSQSPDVNKGDNNGINKQFIPKVDYIIDYNITVRIRYIIRSIKYTNSVLFLFPEQKWIDKAIKDLTGSGIDMTQIHIYTGKKDAHSKKTVQRLLNGDRIIVFGLRSSLFLPYNSLDAIFCIDEGNPFYIQEQNSIYYDTREVVFLAAQSFQTSLTFISNLPSIRLHRIASEKRLDDNTIKYTSQDSNRLYVSMNTPESKFTKNSLFSDELSELLDSFKPDQEYSVNFEAEE